MDCEKVDFAHSLQLLSQAQPTRNSKRPEEITKKREKEIAREKRGMARAKAS